jgi:cob(I)alamin adenosyltransferase
MNCIHIYTGNGKGKTTAAMGLALRFLGAGGRVSILQFDKGAHENQDFYSERKTLAALVGLSLFPFGMPRFEPSGGKFRFENLEQDFREVEKGLVMARTVFQNGSGLVVLDELLSLVMTKLAKPEAILALLDDYEKMGRPCELVMTGHAAWPELIDRVDLVTEMRKRKHYFDNGLEARRGIEY